eukprot:g7229.t1
MDTVSSLLFLDTLICFVVEDSRGSLRLDVGISWSTLGLFLAPRSQPASATLPSLFDGKGKYMKVTAAHLVLEPTDKLVTCLTKILLVLAKK